MERAPTGSAADIADGLPQVYLATSEAFVAQMLNLDVTGGIALDKGCYTGQEIIARAHYRGHVKRRMQRFISETPCSLIPGQTGKFTDGRSFKVVDAVAVEQGRCEFLAVANPQDPGGAAAQTEEDKNWRPCSHRKPRHSSPRVNWRYLTNYRRPEPKQHWTRRRRESIFK